MPRGKTQTPAVIENRPRPTRQQRRSKDELREVRQRIRDELEKRHPMGVRQVCYLLAADGTIAKTPEAFKRTGEIQVEMREAWLDTVRARGLAPSSSEALAVSTSLAGEPVIPFEWIEDDTRQWQVPNMWTGVGELLEQDAQIFRHRVWDTQPIYLYVVIEKYGLSATFYEVTRTYGVPLGAIRGNSSSTFLYSTAIEAEDRNKSAYVLQFGDFDHQGRIITADTQRRLRRYAPSVDWRFERLAVNDEQIDEYNLPTRPAKAERDTESRAVDLDAMPPELLQQLARDRIEQLIDLARFKRTRRQDERDRKWLKQRVTDYGEGKRA